MTDKIEDKSTIKHILEYWYPPNNWDRHTVSSQEAGKRQWSGGAEVDDYCRKHFQNVSEAIERGELEHWKQDRDGRLAYIIACDQFPRNIFRKQGRAFAFDKFSLAAAKEIVENPEILNQYKNFEKQFILMPLMHSENAEDILKCAELYQQIADQAEKDNLPEVAKSFLGFKRFAISHHEPVAKFGRYPSRNEALGRKNTEEEDQYLKNANKWGQ